MATLTACPTCLGDGIYKNGRDEEIYNCPSCGGNGYKTPKVYISHFTNLEGQHVWQVQDTGPLCVETDRLSALIVYERRYRSGIYYDANGRGGQSDIPEFCYFFWNGDEARFEDSEGFPLEVA